MPFWKRAGATEGGVAIGIDGDAVESEAVVVDGDETLLGRARGGGIDAGVVGEAAAAASLRAVAEAAVAAAGLTAGDVAYGGISLPGGAPWAAAALGELLGRRSCLTSERARTAFEAAGIFGDGVAVWAGLSTTAWARNRQGRVVRAGGWGEPLTGAGAWETAWRTLRAACEAEDGRSPKSPLAAAARAACGVERTEAMARIFSAQGMTPELAWRLLSALASASGAGDPVAKRVIGAAGAEVAKVAVAALEGAGLRGERVVVALIGPLWAYGAFQEALRHRLSAVAPDATVVVADMEPARAVARLAQGRGERPHRR